MMPSMAPATSMMLVLPAKTTVASHESVNDEENVIEGQALQQVWATRTKSQELVRAHIHSKLVSVGYGPQAGPHIFWVLRGLGVWGLG